MKPVLPICSVCFEPARDLGLKDTLGVVCLGDFQDLHHILLAVASQRILMLSSVVQVDKVVVCVDRLRKVLDVFYRTVSELVEKLVIRLIIPRKVQKIYCSYQRGFPVERKSGARLTKTVLLHSLHAKYVTPVLPA